MTIKFVMGKGRRALSHIPTCRTYDQVEALGKVIKGLAQVRRNLVKVVHDTTGDLCPPQDDHQVANSCLTIACEVRGLDDLIRAYAKRLPNNANIAERS